MVQYLLLIFAFGKLEFLKKYKTLGRHGLVVYFVILPNKFHEKTVLRGKKISLASQGYFSN